MSSRAGSRSAWAPLLVPCSSHSSVKSAKGAQSLMLTSGLGSQGDQLRVGPAILLIQCDNTSKLSLEKFTP